MAKGILALWMDVAPDQEDEVTEWYIREHIPDRIAVPTYVRARRFKARHGAGYVAIYDATSVTGLSHPGYLALLGNISEWGLRMRGAFSGTARGTFRCLASVAAGEGSSIATLRFRASGAEARAAIAKDLVPRIAAARGMVAAEMWTTAPEERARMDALRITGKADTHVDDVLLIEGTSPAAIDAVLATLTPELASRGAADVVTGTYAYQYGISKLPPSEE
jgi:hypothetical protein